MYASHLSLKHANAQRPFGPPPAQTCSSKPPSARAQVPFPPGPTRQHIHLYRHKHSQDTVRNRYKTRLLTGLPQCEDTHTHTCTQNTPSSPHTQQHTLFFHMQICTGSNSHDFQLLNLIQELHLICVYFTKSRWLQQNFICRCNPAHALTKLTTQSLNHSSTHSLILLLSTSPLTQIGRSRLNIVLN